MLGTQIECAGDGDVVLTLDVLETLKRAGLKLEHEYDGPVDVEWGWTGERLVFFQCRRAEVGDGDSVVDDYQRREVARLCKQTGDGGVELWVQHNLAESLPAPTPLTWDVVRTMMKGEGGFVRLYRELGYTPSRRVIEDGFLELCGGRIYASTGRMLELFGRCYPFDWNPDSLRRDPSLLDQAPTHFVPERTDPWFLFRLPGLAYVLLRATRAAACRRGGRAIRTSRTAGLVEIRRRRAGSCA